MNDLRSQRDTWTFGFFMFALFLGAGNIIFPPTLGQQAGDSLWLAIFGFLLTGVGLPVLAVIAISISGSLDEISRKAHPAFAVLFPFIVYLTIGPFFGIPRTATVAYEIGIVPFLSVDGATSLFWTTLLFFALTFILSLNPTKLVNRIGKIMTPLLLLLIIIIAIRVFISPIGSIEKPIDKYAHNTMISGVLEGYLTMDAIAALVFGMVVINRIKEKGITKASDIKAFTIRAGIVAGIGLSFVYITLAFIGATSVNVIGMQQNGGTILSMVVENIFGIYGTMILALVIALACLTTSVGLVSACGEYLSKTFKKLPYIVVIAIICLFSFTMANLGLNQLISFSLPVLYAIYPIAIVLILLSIVNAKWNITNSIYLGAVIGAGAVSILDGLKTAGFSLGLVEGLLQALPFYANGMGWIFPSFILGLFGAFYKK